MSDVQLIQLFRTVAGRVDKRDYSQVTKDSVITDLGIDSLSMMQIVGEMEQELNIVIPDEELVQIRTVGDLVKKVEPRLS